MRVKTFAVLLLTTPFIVADDALFDFLDDEFYWKVMEKVRCCAPLLRDQTCFDSSEFLTFHY